MHIDGGRWRSGTRDNNSFKNLAKWAEAGFFTASIDYRLVGGSPAPAAYEDTQCAIRWLHANAQDLRIDPARIYLIGDSAGGHLVSLAATLGDGPYARVGGWEKAANNVRAVISVAGANDLPTLPWGNLWTPASGDVDAARKLALPIQHVGPSARPILVIHSDDDRSVPIEQAVNMAKALAAASVHHRFVHYKDRGHMGLTDEVLQEALAFITEVERKSASLLSSRPSPVLKPRFSSWMSRGGPSSRRDRRRRGALGVRLRPRARLRAGEALKIARTTETRCTCPYCSVSCGVIIHTLGDKAKNVTPQVVHVEGDPDHPINRGTLCPKGASLEQDILNDAAPASSRRCAGPAPITGRTSPGTRPSTRSRAG